MKVVHYGMQQYDQDILLQIVLILKLMFGRKDDIL